MPTATEDSIYGPSGAQALQPLLPYRNYLSDLYPYALSSVYHGHRLWDPSYADSRDPDLWERIRRDPVVAAACEIRMHSVASRFWRVIPGGQTSMDEGAASVVEEMVQGIERFAQSRYELAGAVLTARSFAYIEGDRQFGAYGGRFARWWVPTKITDIDRRRIHHAPVWSTEPDGRRTLRTQMMLWSVTENAWRPIQDLRPFVRHIYNDEEARLGYGRGLIEAVYFYWYAKTIALQKGLRGLERWAEGGFAVGVDGLKAASTTKDNDTIVAAWKDAWKAWFSHYLLVHDKADELKPVPGPSEGHQMVHEWLRYLDDAITRLILGSVLPSGGASEQGSLARAEVEEDTTESLIQYDRILLDDTLTRDLVGCIWFQNRQLFLEMFPGAKMPKFSSVQEKRSDPTEAAQVVATLHGAGIALREDEVYERTGFTAPGPEDKVLAGAAPGAGLDALFPRQVGTKGMGGEGGAPAQSLRMTHDGDSVVLLGADGSDRAIFDIRERCPDGTVMPKDGDCSDHGPAKDDPSGAKPPETKEKKEKKGKDSVPTRPQGQSAELWAKNEEVAASRMGAARPSKSLMDVYQTAVRTKDMSIEEIVYGDEVPEWIWDSPVFRTAFESGRNGDPMLTYVSGWRYGDIPESGYSYNYREQQLEPGLSLMALTGEPPVKSLMTGVQGRPIRWVEGWLITEPGGEGESLIVGAKYVEGIQGEHAPEESE